MALESDPELSVDVERVGDLPDPHDLAASDFPGVHSGGIANHLTPHPSRIGPAGLYRVSGTVAAEVDARRGSAGYRVKPIEAFRRTRREALMLKRQLQRQTPPRL
jgi:hypothetical protein